MSKYCSVGILSNLYKEMYPKLVQRGLIPNITYSPIIISSEERLIKPDRRIFELAQDRSDKSASQLMLLDDLQTNIEVTRSIGWTGVRYDNENPEEAVGLVLRSLAS